MIFTKRHLLLLALQLYSIVSTAQISGVVLDRSSGKPVPYASIWIEGERIGVNSEEDGSFRIDLKVADYLTKHLIISCIGYADQRSAITEAPITLELAPTSVLLKELFLFSAKNTLTKTIGTLNRNQINRWHGSACPSMLAHFQSYNEDFKTFPFLRRVVLASTSKVHKAQFRVRIFEATADGKPGSDLVDPVFGYAPKGTGYATIDLTEQNFKIPEDGFFIAVEWLILERNKLYKKMHLSDTDKRVDVAIYEPYFGTSLPGKGSKNWMHESGRWGKTHNNWEGGKLHENTPVDHLLFQLVVSN